MIAGNHRAFRFNRTVRLNLLPLGIVKVNFSSTLAYPQLSPFTFQFSALNE